MELSFFEIALLMVLGGCAVSMIAPLFRVRSRQRRLDERLVRCDHPAEPQQTDGFRLLRETNTFLPVLRLTTELERDALRHELSKAGFTSAAACEVYLLSRVIAGITGAVLASAISLICGVHGLVMLLAMGCGTGAAFMFPEWIVRRRQKERARRIRRSLPELLDLMSISIEAGNSTDVAMREATLHIQRSSNLLSQELALYFKQLDLGRSKAEALRDLGLRTDEADLRAFTSTLAQTHRFGTDVSLALKHQSERMRIARRQHAEERARQASFLLLFPLLIFIFPGVFVVLVGPAAISIMRDVLALR